MALPVIQLKIDSLEAEFPRLRSLCQRDSFRQMPKIVALRLRPDGCISQQIEVRYEEHRQTKVVWVTGKTVDSQVARVVGVKGAFRQLQDLEPRKSEARFVEP